VAVGRAIVRAPKCFLFDEPLSNLDAKLRVEMRAELKRLHRQLQTTTIYVTHDQEEAMTLGDRVVVMKDGLIQQCGSPLEIYRRPINRFVAGFVGTPPMNFLEGTLVRSNGDLWFDEGAAQIRVPDQMRPSLADHVDRPIVLGLRPEAISDEPDGHDAGQDNAIRLKIDVIEPLGDKMDVYLSTAQHPHIVARIDARRDLAPESEHDFYVDTDRIHLFDTSDSGLNLTCSVDAGAEQHA
jgi:multiple sugar transport system ATP-binding protein